MVFPLNRDPEVSHTACAPHVDTTTRQGCHLVIRGCFVCSGFYQKFFYLFGKQIPPPVITRVLGAPGMFSPSPSQHLVQLHPSTDGLGCTSLLPFTRPVHVCDLALSAGRACDLGPNLAPPRFRTVRGRRKALGQGGLPGLRTAPTTAPRHLVPASLASRPCP